MCAIDCWTDYAAVRRLVVSRPFKGKMISVKRVAQTRKVLMRGVPASVTSEHILLYFENHTGTDVTHIQPCGDHVVITFGNSKGDTNILMLLCIRSS